MRSFRLLLQWWILKISQVGLGSSIISSIYSLKLVEMIGQLYLIDKRKALIQLQQHGGHGAVKWFKDAGPLDRWTRWKFYPSLVSDENTNNYVESFNSTIGANRTNLVLTFLEGVRRIVMVRHATTKQIAEQWADGGITPNIRDRLRVITKDSRFCQTYPSGRGNYGIHDGRAKLPVLIHPRLCTCGRWQHSGIPCKHGIIAILYEGKDLADFVHDSVAKYKEAYIGNISPVPDQEQWPMMEGVPTLVPPTMKRIVGRPSRNRRLEEGDRTKERKKKQHCEV